MQKMKDLTELKRLILHELSEKSKRWSELWNPKMFRSTRYLQKCLKELENEGLVKRVRISHKNVKYVTAAHYKTWQQLITGDEKAEKELEGWLESIESIKDWSEGRASHWIISAIAQIILRFSVALERTARTTEEFQPYVRLYLLERALDRWGRTLIAYGKAHPTATDTALSAIRGQQFITMLEARRASGTLPPKDTEIGELGFDIKKALDDFKRIILPAVLKVKSDAFDT